MGCALSSGTQRIRKVPGASNFRQRFTRGRSSKHDKGFLGLLRRRRRRSAVTSDMPSAQRGGSRGDRVHKVDFLVVGHCAVSQGGCHGGARLRRPSASLIHRHRRSSRRRPSPSGPGGRRASTVPSASAARDATRVQTRTSDGSIGRAPSCGARAVASAATRMWTSGWRRSATRAD